MKTAFVLLAAGLLSANASFAQSQGKSRSVVTQKETIVISREGNDNTTIEINGEGVFLNGDKIASRAELNNRNLEKKIIIRNGRGEPSSNEMPWKNDESVTDRRAMLGVFMDARAGNDGAHIQKVSSGSAAERAGLRSGDIIIQIDDRQIKDSRDLTETIRSHNADDRVTITYLRNGKERQTTAMLDADRRMSFSIQEMAPMPPMGNMPCEGWYQDERPKLGVTVEENGSGVLIRAVRPGSVADDGDLKEGDVITYIDDRKLSNVDQLQREVERVGAGERMKVEIRRNGNRMTKMLEFPRSGSRKDL